MLNMNYKTDMAKGDGGGGGAKYAFKTVMEHAEDLIKKKAIS
jgi:hypothetical protein